MPLETFNPVLSGFHRSISDQHILANQQLQQKELELAQKREQRQSQMQALDNEIRQADLQSRLSAMGARAMTPADEAEHATGIHVDYGKVGLDMERNVAAMGPSDLHTRLVTVGGQKYVLPSADEREGLADKASARATKRKVAETEAVETGRERAKTNAIHARLETEGIPISDEQADLLGYKRGLKILPEHQDDFLRSLTSAQTRKAAAEKAAKDGDDPVSGTDIREGADGYVAFKKHKSGKVETERLNVKGKPRAAASGTSAGDVRAGKQAVEKLASDIYAEAGGDPDKAFALAREKAKTDPQVKGNLLKLKQGFDSSRPKKTAAAGDDTSALVRQFQELSGGAPTPTTAPPKPTKGQVPMSKVKAYAKAKGLDLKTATQHATESGYEVTP